MSTADGWLRAEYHARRRRDRALLDRIANGPQDQSPPEPEPVRPPGAPKVTLTDPDTGEPSSPSRSLAALQSAGGRRSGGRTIDDEIRRQARNF